VGLALPSSGTAEMRGRQAVPLRRDDWRLPLATLDNQLKAAAATAGIVAFAP